MATLDVASHDQRFVAPLRADAVALHASFEAVDRVVLLGSVATDKYAAPLLAVFGKRLLVPSAFAGRGGMSRGGLLLRCADAGTELAHVPLATAPRRGPRPPRLPPRRRRPAATPELARQDASS